jgi:hypothetical protein
MQRNPNFLPTLDERPVHRAQMQMLATPANEGVFDFGEVVEVIQSR